MTEAEHTQQPNDHGPAHYLKIWAILLILLVVSICGPMLGFRVITLLTAFGVALVKAGMVASEFMHLKLERKYITYMLLTMVLLMAIFFFGVAPDVMKNHGENWSKQSFPESAESPSHASGGQEGSQP